MQKVIYLICSLILTGAFCSSLFAAEPIESVWIDVRSTEEYSEGHVSDAVHIPHTEILLGVETAGYDKDTEILLYCGSGRRAGLALTALEEAGYTNVVNKGGYEDIMASMEQEAAED